ncbi:MAG: hypothetical protein CMM91_05910 [Rickettsiales bacterium]|nr:hypothetical protein [Rickettsiales bacterium]MAI84455.1 hypothetical protein [Rickettsiales bacterium]|tara:strand:- start:3251 stop:5167 length:1917 start_codon:yes stop_codon:yes gene_type:complete
MKINELHNQPVKPDTYEASMALNQLLKIGKHSIKIHNMIDDAAEMESWVAKKIDLAGDYVKKVHGYMQGEKAGLYDDGGMTEDASGWKLVSKAKDIAKKMAGNYTGAVKQIEKLQKDLSKNTSVKKALLQFNEDAPFGSGMDLVRMAVMRKFISADEYVNYAKELKAAGEQVEQEYDDWPEGEGFGSSDGNFAIKSMMSAAGYEFDEQDTSGSFVVTKMPEKLEKMGIKNARMRDAVTTEDAGEGHMSKSTLYHTAKYAIELMDMIKKGDDLEGWVQSKLNKAADYLQGVHNYEEYQKLNPYREEIDSQTFAKHSEIVKKNIDEILARETKLDDIDTKPGMMRILNKRVQEFEKKMAKEARTDEYADTKPRDMAHYRELMKALQDLERDEKVMTDPVAKAEVKRRKLKLMKDKPTNEDKYNFRGNPFPVLGKAQSYLGYGAELAKAVIDKDPSAKVKAETYLDRVPSFINTEMKEIMPTNESGIMYRAGVKKYGKAGMKAIQSAAGKGANHQEIGKIKDRYLKDEELDEGLKDWARNLTAAGIIVGAVAGLGSINNAIDNSVPAVKAMNTALEMAKEKGDTELAKAIEKDLKDAKIRLDIGKDLNHVTYLQDKYSKFMPTEGLAYESKLAIELNKRLK